MALNVAQYLAPLNSSGVLPGLAQGVRDGVGLSIAADGTITLNAVEAATLGFITSASGATTPQYVWPTSGGTVRQTLLTDGSNNLFWSGDYVHTYPLNSPTFPQTGAAALPAGVTASRPTGATEGWTRYNTETGSLELYSGTGWINVSQSGGTVFSFVSASTPTANKAGDLWLDTNSYTEKVWSGTQWYPVIPTASVIAQGRVQIGTNINIDGLGVISVPAATGVSGSIGTVGVTSLTDNVSTTSITSRIFETPPSML
jgi:hypothetical protein